MGEADNEPAIMTLRHRRVLLGSALLGLAAIVAAAAGRNPPIALQSAQPALSIPAQGDEFFGPFPSWTSVKSSYRAAGDGVADDTAAIQQGLNDLGANGHSPV